jgi:hypothetical protein
VSETINGVKILLLRGIDMTSGMPANVNYLLATLDGWDHWLLFIASGSSATSTLAPAYRVLQSVEAPRHYKAPTATRQKFVGTWSVHDARLEITSDSAGVEDLGGAQCSAGIEALGCYIVLTLQTALSRGGTLMTARITKVKAYLDPTRFEIDPRSTVVPAVGDTFQLQFAATGLMIETNLHYPWNSGVFNPWWCGPSREEMPPPGGLYCGA